jgi:hypothetical protein
MKAAIVSWKDGPSWTRSKEQRDRRADLVFYFGATDTLKSSRCYEDLRAAFPSAHLVGCSTGGQIRGDQILDDEIAAVALSFDATRLRIATGEASDPTDSRACGEAIGRQLAGADLAGIFILSDGLHVNGSELVRGVASVVGSSVPLTGGLAGDGPRFENTVVGADGPPRSNLVAAVGFFGPAIRIAHGSAGGWDQFGPRRKITRSKGNVLFELDGEPALDLYERYLGEEDARGLPSAALLFPLLVYEPSRPDDDIVRTILAIDRHDRSMTFAGDMPEGWVAQLMRGNFDRLADGAAKAASQTRANVPANPDGDEVAILVSCIGRRLLMGQNTLDEIEAAGAELGNTVKQIGFYSYGEISPHAVSGVCQLHNQTMTITTLSEAAA